MAAPDFSFYKGNSTLFVFCVNANKYEGMKTRE